MSLSRQDCRSREEMESSFSFPSCKQGFAALSIQRTRFCVGLCSSNMEVYLILFTAGGSLMSL